MRISDWSSDVCSSDLRAARAPARRRAPGAAVLARRAPPPAQADGGRLLRPAGAVVPGTRPGPAHRAGRPDQRMNTETSTAQNSARSQAMSSRQPEPNVATDEATPVPGNVLRILSGLHAGASRDLAEQEMIMVGSHDACDIVLERQSTRLNSSHKCASRM